MSVDIKSVSEAEAKQTLSSGQVFTQYLLRGPIVQKRRIFLFYESPQEDAKLGTLFWCSEFGDRVPNSKDSLPLDTITDVKLEKQSPVFQSDVAADAQKECCFSLCSSSVNLELEAPSLSVLSPWLSACLFIVQQVRKQIVRMTSDIKLATPQKRYSGRGTTPKRSEDSDEDDFEFGEANDVLGSLEPRRLTVDMHQDRATLTSTRLSLVNMLAKRSDRVKLLEDKLNVLSEKLTKTEDELGSLSAQRGTAGAEGDDGSDSKGAIEKRQALETENATLAENLERVNSLLAEEKQRRAMLLNQVIEMQGNIRVFCRVRPSCRSEQGSAITFLEEETLKVSDQESGFHKEFAFDKVFNQQSTQDEVFNEVSPLVHSCMDGYTVCIFAYGQTGAGKTYTMEGSATQLGVNYRSLELLFLQVNKQRLASPEVTFDVSLSVVEVYLEEVRDLLSERDSKKKCDLREGPSGVYIPNLTEIPVQDMEDFRTLVKERAYPNREVRGTSMNQHSSRSHCLLFVTCKRTDTRTGMTKLGKLVLIDLAGSERLKKSEVSGQGLKEAQAINKSLAALGNVIYSLQGDANHVPYRDSKLTFLLQNCLGGGCKCLMFCQVSPSVADFQETKCTLQFAVRVRATKLGQAKASTTTASNHGKEQVTSRKLESKLSEKERAMTKLKTRFEAQLKEKDVEIERLRQQLARSAAVLSNPASGNQENQPPPTAFVSNIFPLEDCPPPAKTTRTTRSGKRKLDSSTHDSDAPVPVRRRARTQKKKTTKSTVKKRANSPPAMRMTRTAKLRLQKQQAAKGGASKGRFCF